MPKEIAMHKQQSSVRANGGHTFRAGGLVDLSRATYQRTPLAVTEIGPKIFCFMGAGAQ